MYHGVRPPWGYGDKVIPPKTLSLDLKKTRNPGENVAWLTPGREKNLIKSHIREWGRRRLEETLYASSSGV